MIELALATGPMTLNGAFLIGVAYYNEEQSHVHVSGMDRPLLVQETYAVILARVLAAIPPGPRLTEEPMPARQEEAPS